MFKKILSYIIPLTVLKQNSSISQSLEVTLTNGELVLDSQNTNYSFGSLQRVLRKGLLTIGFDTISSMQHVLVLGVAGGSVIKTLVEEIKYKGKITGVEIDPEIIKIANDYFKLNEIPNLEIVIQDALKFVTTTKTRYDLIVIDVFQDSTMPAFLFEVDFVNQLQTILSSNGFILFNTMLTNTQQSKRNKEYIALFDAKQFSIQRIPRVEQHNELIIIQKVSDKVY